MAKKVLKINDYEGGINRSADPRDIKENELEEAFNVNVSRKGRITMPGNALSTWYTYNDHNYEYYVDEDGKSFARLQRMALDDRHILSNGVGLTNGYGLFSCSHDYTSNGMDESDVQSSPQPQESEFILINDGAHIHLWDSCFNDEGNKGQSRWVLEAINLGGIHQSEDIDNTAGSAEFGNKVKPIYYKADNGIRVCDGNFNEAKIGTVAGHSYDTNDFPDTEWINSNTTRIDTLYLDDYSFTSEDIGKYLKIYGGTSEAKTDSYEIVEVQQDYGTYARVRRGALQTSTMYHGNGAQVYMINTPKVLEHIKATMLEKAYAMQTSDYTAEAAAGTTSDFSITKRFTNESINEWNERIQSCEPPELAIRRQAGRTQKRGLTVFDGKVTAMGYNSYASNEYSNPGAADDFSNTHHFFPNQPESVVFSMHQSNSADDNIIECDEYTQGSPINGIETVELTSTGASFIENGYSIGKQVIISGSDAGSIDGLAEIVGYGSTEAKLVVSTSIADDSSADTTADFTVRLEENRIDENLNNKYVLGMSYLYDGGGSDYQESPIEMGSIYNGLIPEDDSIIGSNAGSRWKTSGSDNTAFGTAVPVQATGDHWVIDNSGLRFIDGNIDGNVWVGYQAPSGTVVGGRYYRVAITVSEAGLFSIYPPGYQNNSGDAATGGYKIYNNDNIADTDNIFESIDTPGTYFFAFKASETNENSQNLFVVKGTTTKGNTTITNVQVFEYNSTEMDANNTIDMRGWQGIPKFFSSFNMNKSSTYKWNPSIRGYKIYMKQVDSATAELSADWLLLMHSDFKKGTFVNYGNDELERPLALHSGAEDWDASGVNAGWTKDGSLFTNSLVATSISLKSSEQYFNSSGISDYSTLRNIPLQTYESENAYKGDVNTTAMYKTATMINRKVFIGNIHIGGKSYPDRMIESPVDKYDIFPDDGLHYIDVATSDGDAIVKLESVDNKLIQFKEHHAYVLQVDSEGVDLIESWNGKGIKNPSQVVRAGNGIVWVNNYGLYYYDGEKLTDVTLDKFEKDVWKVNEQNSTPPILAYDESSNKVIVQTTNHFAKRNGGYIYDMNTQSITEAENLFLWHVKDGDADDAIEDSFEESVAAPSTFRSNIITTKNKLCCIATNTINDGTRVEFNRWDDDSAFLWQWTDAASKFKLQTKDIDFENPSRRKKVYKVYITFKAYGYLSGVRVRYATNGSNSFSGTFKDTTYYTDAKGFDSWNGSVVDTETGAITTNNSSQDWITVALKPSSSINNIFSMQLKFDFANAGHSGYKVSYDGGLLGRRGIKHTLINGDTVDLYNALTTRLTNESGVASSTDDYYNGMPFFIYDGAGYGADFRVIDYDKLTKQVILDCPPNSKLLNETFLANGLTSAYDLGHIPKYFQINDISVVYREKSIK